MNRKLLIRLGALLSLLLVAALMFAIGRGHTIYFDNKNFEYNGQNYPAFYRVKVFVNGQQAAKLSPKDRGSVTNIGRNFTMHLELQANKGGEKQNKAITLKLPYHLDGIVVNLPALLAGLPQDVWQSEFVPITSETSENSGEAASDEFNMPKEP